MPKQWRTCANCGKHKLAYPPLRNDGPYFCSEECRNGKCPSKPSARMVTKRRSHETAKLAGCPYEHYHGKRCPRCGETK